MNCQTGQTVCGLLLADALPAGDSERRSFGPEEPVGSIELERAVINHYDALACRRQCWW
uniref:Oxidoreductase n=1 Tax=Macrostomum lignano TaxID=282301 RepID=A0A1I8FNY3_9PLAT